MAHGGFVALGHDERHRDMVGRAWECRCGTKGVGTKQRVGGEQGQKDTAGRPWDHGGVGTGTPWV